MVYSDLYANRIRSLCEKQGITINRLATLSGLKQSTIDNIIHGRSRNPKARTLHRIANTFNMTLSEFLDFPELNDCVLEDEDDA
ncbi:MAG: helix-turn-helix transcriptional regulator [Eubacteriales bacterium]|nr:helix-turn-helix transcriptional regulator [Eubacteriales bacterium]